MFCIQHFTILFKLLSTTLLISPNTLSIYSILLHNSLKLSASNSTDMFLILNITWTVVGQLFTFCWKTQTKTCRISFTSENSKLCLTICFDFDYKINQKFNILCIVLSFYFIFYSHSFKNHIRDLKLNRIRSQLINDNDVCSCRTFAF